MDTLNNKDSQWKPPNGFTANKHITKQKSTKALKRTSNDTGKTPKYRCTKKNAKTTGNTADEQPTSGMGEKRRRQVAALDTIRGAEGSFAKPAMAGAASHVAKKRIAA